MKDISALITQIAIHPKEQHPIRFGIFMPRNYLDIVPHMDKDHVLKNLNATAKDITDMWEYPVRLDWDNQRGLYGVRLLETDGTSMLLNDSNSAFVPTNVDSLEQAFSLLSIGQEYLQIVMVHYEMMAENQHSP